MLRVIIMLHANYIRCDVRHAMQDSQDAASGNGSFIYVVIVFESLL